ncbi:HAD hydrolase family protein [Mammaliicoccus sciuri]|uniref:HAD family hydrolase n=1 Tax=Mammaliicoccus sciuri TaxID=1296 RepID=UPI002270CFE5|nr:HAD hydrolase family protein [Mammaliicoccus sciuri]MCY1026326.1 HAD hydrolase family protein [Mammaliicoccus sciuri]
MTYKYIVMDMDDTLLTSKNEISEVTYQYLMEKQKEGMKLILASGRPTAGMIKHAEVLDLKSYGGYIVSYNGAFVINAEDQSILFNQTISQKDAHDIIDYCRSHNFFYLTYLNDQIIHDTTHDYMNIESELTGLPMSKVNNIKEAIIGEVSKGKSLQRLFDQFDADFSEVIAFGDSLNDSDMLERAAVGVAMGNANDTIKGIADVVTDDHDHDGIVTALEKILNA